MWPHARSLVVTLAVPTALMRSLIREKLANEASLRPIPVDLPSRCPMISMPVDLCIETQPSPSSRVVGTSSSNEACARILSLSCCFLISYIYPFIPKLPVSSSTSWAKSRVHLPFRDTPRELPSRSISFARRISSLLETFFSIFFCSMISKRVAEKLVC